MLASFGLEIAECGGALAKATAAGDEVHAAVALSPPEAHDQIAQAARILGIANVDYLELAYGEVALDGPSRQRIVRLVREVRPDIVIAQDPEHAQHDLDPDRRMLALLYAEGLALASRDWRVDECGGLPPHPVPTRYHMSPERPNCVVEISDVFERKLEALAVLEYQHRYSAQVTRGRLDAETVFGAIASGDLGTVSGGEAGRGLAIIRASERAIALWHGLASHSGAVLGEAYRREGPFVLDRLTT